VNEFHGKRVLVTRPEEVAELVPLERLGAPQDIPAVVFFLAGPDGSWINGQVLRANGGRV
jgi:3-oxoacyl-[acyl-carrier protein] reductase